jgi:hypothetical protein
MRELRAWAAQAARRAFKAALCGLGQPVRFRGGSSEAIRSFSIRARSPGRHLRDQQMTLHPGCQRPFAFIGKR